MGVDTKLKLEPVDDAKICKSHKSLVEVLIHLDQRLSRMTIILLIAAAAAVGGLAKDIVLPLLVKMAGG